MCEIWNPATRLSAAPSLSVVRATVSNMSSNNKAKFIAALDAAEAAYGAVAALPLETLLPSEQRALLARLEQMDKELTAFRRQLLGRLVTEARPKQFGGASWAEVLSRRLRISQGEAQRRITEAMCAATTTDDPPVPRASA